MRGNVKRYNIYNYVLFSVKIIEFPK